MLPCGCTTMTCIGHNVIPGPRLFPEHEHHYWQGSGRWEDFLYCQGCGKVIPMRSDDVTGTMAAPDASWTLT